MSIEIDVTIVEPIELEVQLQPSFHVGVNQAGPKGDKGDTGEPGTGIDANTLVGTVFGGLFQP